MGGTLSPDELVTFSGSSRAGGPANHPTFGHGRGRNAPPYSYASAISSARTGSRNQADRIGATPPALSAYYDLRTGVVDNAWDPTSASGSGLIDRSENSSGFSSGSNSIVSDQQLLQQQYGQGNIQTPFDEFISPLAPNAYVRSLFDPASNSCWAGDIRSDNVGDGGGMPGLGMSPVSAVSYSGSLIDGSAGSPEMSGGSEINFNGTAGFANSSLASYASASVSSAPTSPASSRRHHENKRLKKSKTGVSAAAVAREDSISTSASSSASRGGKRKQPKRELRSASRTSKNTQQRTQETTDERKSRNSHNLVEKQYRNRLNAQFEGLLETLPDTLRFARSRAEQDGEDAQGESGRAVDAEEKRVSKGEVLDMARRHINNLEEEKASLENERDGLQQNFDSLRDAYAAQLAKEGRSLDDDELLRLSGR